MAIGDLNIVSYLKSKMKWHQARQRVLSENVANADTPRYRPNDLKPLSFQDALKLGSSTNAAVMKRTHAMHFASASGGSNSAFNSGREVDFEMTPGGNGVVLEDQMMKVAENTFDYQMASSIYSRSLGLIRTALGRNG